MSPMFRLLVRIAESGRESRDINYHHNEYRDSDGDSNGDDGLPWYAVLLIVYFSILFLVVWSSLVYFYTRDRERRNGQPVRVGHIVLKALTVASGVGVWIWVFKKRGWYGSDREQEETTGVGPYKQIKTRKTPAPIGVSTPFGSPSGSSTLPASPNAPSVWPPSPNTPTTWYGTQTSQTTTYASYEQSSDMYKSPGHNPTPNAFAQHESIPMITLTPSPSTSPAPQSSPTPNPSYAPPPPYVTTPPPAALYGQKFPS
ncbi:hypothetical protein F5B22DRAFT_461181 [Xylaria bambusicola]|uniref:uncharacterized protein n=1 Tax=Xylaria bambusicola TaxID=326684 RepID=UPI002007E46F|nr:uncharacterized protein F5B22DRAFT_461181 [Xylaria bambusicola]KAI0522154.1 hypothetical protein F5B22DRAFT_461181 [Xylaria bambusicola]